MKTLCELCASVRNSSYLPCRFQISWRSKRTRRGSRPSFKNPLCPLCLCAKLFIPPTAFWISRRSQRTRRGGRKSVEKPLFETLPLTEITKDTKRRSDKSLKTSVPPCETLCTSHAVFRSHGDHKGQGEKTRQIIENPL